jgi:GNAT superfamily N-acetyltransferase
MPTFSPLQLEELSLNAWPALQTLLLDGWVLRFAGGYTRRANSVNPLYASSLPVDEKIALCEQHYQAQGLPAVFKLTPQAQPSALDADLDRHGYRLEARTSVQTLDLHSARYSAPATFSVTETEAWFSAFCSLSCTPAGQLAPMRQLLNLILPSHAFGWLQMDGQPVACGLSVTQAQSIGCYDIVVAKAQRGKGYGRQIMAGLLAYGQQQGAQQAYLQVMLNNEPALGLYAGLGFQEAYQYWYRVK